MLRLASLIAAPILVSGINLGEAVHEGGACCGGRDETAWCKDAAGGEKHAKEECKAYTDALAAETAEKDATKKEPLTKTVEETLKAVEAKKEAAKA